MNSKQVVLLLKKDGWSLKVQKGSHGQIVDSAKNLESLVKKMKKLLKDFHNIHLAENFLPKKEYCRFKKQYIN